MQLPIQIPFQEEILEHQKKFSKHTKFTIYGTNKKEKLSFLFCKICKKSIGIIKLRSSKSRRKVVI